MHLKMNQLEKAINTINRFNKGDKTISESTAIGYYLLANNILKTTNSKTILVPIPKR